MVLGFGKHKEIEISDAPVDYLQFIVKQDWFCKVNYKVRKAICDRLKIDFIPSDNNEFKAKFGRQARGNAILNKQLKRDIDFDNFKDKNK